MAGGFATVAGNFTDTQIFHVKKGFSVVHQYMVCVCVCVCVCVKYTSKENWKKNHILVTHMGSDQNQVLCSAHSAVWGQPLQAIKLHFRENPNYCLCYDMGRNHVYIFYHAPYSTIDRIHENTNYMEHLISFYVI